MFYNFIKLCLFYWLVHWQQIFYRRYCSQSAAPFSCHVVDLEDRGPSFSDVAPFRVNSSMASPRPLPPRSEPSFLSSDDGGGVGQAAEDTPPRRPPLSLADAMAAADCIRRVYSEDDPSELGSAPPGVAEGLAAFVATGLLLSPFRGALLGASPVALRTLCDLAITPLVAVAAAQAGLVAGSVFGSRVYLQQVAYVAPLKESPVTDRACRDLLRRLRLLPDGTPDTPPPGWWDPGPAAGKDLAAGSAGGGGAPSSSWDPRVETMQSLRLAVENCQKRSSLNPREA